MIRVALIQFFSAIAVTALLCFGAVRVTEILAEHGDDRHRATLDAEIIKLQIMIRNDNVRGLDPHFEKKVRNA